MLAGCATAAPTPPSEWAIVALPGDAAAVTLTAYRDELLVGTRPTDDTAAPGLVRLQGSTTTVLAVTPASGYGPEARWLSIAVDDGGDLVAVGGARGGAHANVRWTVWRGSTESGLREEEQTFDTFGGWGAGDLVGAVAAPSGPAIVGSWGSRAGWPGRGRLASAGQQVDPSGPGRHGPGEHPGRARWSRRCGPGRVERPHCWLPRALGHRLGDPGPRGLAIGRPRLAVVPGGPARRRLVWRGNGRGMPARELHRGRQRRRPGRGVAARPVR